MAGDQLRRSRIWQGNSARGNALPLICLPCNEQSSWQRRRCISQSPEAHRVSPSRQPISWPNIPQSEKSCKKITQQHQVISSRNAPLKRSEIDWNQTLPQHLGLASSAVEKVAAWLQFSESATSPSEPPDRKQLIDAALDLIIPTGSFGVWKWWVNTPNQLFLQLFLQLFGLRRLLLLPPLENIEEMNKWWTGVRISVVVGGHGILGASLTYFPQDYLGFLDNLLLRHHFVEFLQGSYPPRCCHLLKNERHISDRSKYCVRFPDIIFLILILNVFCAIFGIIFWPFSDRFWDFSGTNSGKFSDRFLHDFWPNSGQFWNSFGNQNIRILHVFIYFLLPASPVPRARAISRRIR